MEPLAGGERFRFACHSGVRCFTDCCRDLHLVLTPYDLLRLKKALGMDSSEFLERYTTGEVDPAWNIPVVKLKMGEDSSRACPFVGADGCGVYGDRPGACRAYPLARAARRPVSGGGPAPVEESFFLVQESHCLGFEEGPLWTAGEWIQDQGLSPYNEMNDLWMDFLSRYRPGSRGGLSDHHWKMFFMACYSVDRFREFVFRTRFLSLFSISKAVEERIRDDDRELLRFGLRWLAFSLFGDPVLESDSPSVDDAGP